MTNLKGLTRRIRRNEGQALIEFALTVPMVFLLVVNLVNFGGLFFAWITIANAARAGADYAILGGASVVDKANPSISQIKSIITAEVASLPNNSSVVVTICQNNNGVFTPSTCTAANAPADPEAGSYVTTSVDVTYTYKPFIPVYSFKSLGVYLTLPTSTIDQKALMRSIQ